MWILRGNQVIKIEQQTWKFVFKKMKKKSCSQDETGYGKDLTEREKLISEIYELI